MATPKTPAGPPDEDGLVTHTHPETPVEAEEFWTEQRRRGTAPVPVPMPACPPVLPEEEKEPPESQ